MLLRSGYERDKIAKAAAKAASMLMRPPPNVREFFTADPWPSVSGWYRIHETLLCCGMYEGSHSIHSGEAAYLTAPSRDGDVGFNVYCMQHRPTNVSPP